MNRKSQVDKFNRKYGKDYLDEKAIKENNIEKSREALPGLEDLKKQGSIKEAAVVFSQEGMKLFSTLFANTIESAIEKKLQDVDKRVESSIEKKMIEMLEGMTEGMQSALGNKGHTSEPKPNINVRNIFNEVEDSIMENINKKDEEDKPVSYENDNWKPKAFSGTIAEKPKKFEEPKKREEVKKEPMKSPSVDTNLPVGTVITTSKKDIEIGMDLILKYFKQCKGQEVLSRDITGYFKKEKGIKFMNTTVVMNALLKSNPFLTKEGFGTYMYKERSFNSLV